MTDYEQLKQNGELEKLLELAESQLDSNEAKIWQLYALWKLGKLDKGMELAKEYLSNDQDLSEFDRTMLTYRLASLHYARAEYSIALKFMMENLEFFLNNDYFKLAADTYNFIGTIHLSTGDVNQSIPAYEKAIEYYEKAGEFHSQGMVLNNLGSYHYYIGEYDKALSYYTHSLGIFRQSGRESNTASPLEGLGLIYRQIGKNDLALDYFDQSLKIHQEFGSIAEIAQLYGSMSGIYRMTGELDKSLEFNYKALDLLEQLKADAEIAMCLAVTIQVKVDLGDLEGIQSDLDRIKSISETTNNKLVDQYYRFARANVLKSSKRLPDLIRAQDILTTLLEEDLQVAFRITILKLSTELLLLEYKSYEDQEVFDQILDNVDILYDLAKNQHMYPTMISSQILRARLVMINNNFDRAMDILDQALDLANNHEMVEYTELIQRERHNLTEYIQNLKDALDDTTFLDRIEDLELMNYIQNLQNSK